MDETQGGRQIESVNRTFEILHTLRALDSASLSEIGAEMELSLGGLHSHLSTLAKQGFVERDGYEYKLGPQFLYFGEYVRYSNPVYRAAKGEIDELAVSSGECVHLITEKRGKELILYESFGDRAVAQKFFIENRQTATRCLHYTAAGKAILAQYDEDRVDEIVDEHGLPPSTEHSITDRAELETELAAIRDRGYATSIQEDLLGLQAVGAPIFDSDGSVRAALSMTVPVDRVDESRDLGDLARLVNEYADIVEINLQSGEESI